MRYGIFSDVHSNLEALQAVVASYANEEIDQVLCAGDVVGYAADPNECVKIIGSLAIATVAGNHDWAVVDLFSLEHLNPFAQAAVIWTRRHLKDTEARSLKALDLVFANEDLALVHGTLNNPQDFNYMTDEYMAEESFSRLKAPVCFIGHTHQPGVFVQDKSGALEYRQSETLKMNAESRYIINVGSVGQPRDGNPKAAYCIYDTDKKEIQIKRVRYDTETARKKIINAGLPQFLGDRLLAGR